MASQLSLSLLILVTPAAAIPASKDVRHTAAHLRVHLTVMQNQWKLCNPVCISYDMRCSRNAAVVIHRHTKSLQTKPHVALLYE
eukprot:1702927-Amphidinium_carterae.1